MLRQLEPKSLKGLTLNSKEVSRDAAAAGFLYLLDTDLDAGIWLHYVKIMLQSYPLLQLQLLIQFISPTLMRYDGIRN